MAIDTATEERTVVGVFRDGDEAKEALRRMSAAGFSADRVGITSDVRQAREPAGSFSPRGAVIGGLVGAAVAAFFVLWLDGQIFQNIVALALGFPGLIVAGAAIGALAGRSRALKDEYRDLERPVERGGTLVTVTCDSTEVSRAQRALRDAGASAVRVEETGEAL